MKETKNYSFFSNRDCEFYPCHKSGNPDNFNCLFCYCPLYHQGEQCGGNFTHTKDGIKDCSACTFPHQRENYDKIIRRIRG